VTLVISAFAIRDFIHLWSNFQASYLRQTLFRFITAFDADDKISIKEFWRRFNIKWRLLYVSYYAHFYYTR
jgi:hypothetical protein